MLRTTKMLIAVMSFIVMVGGGIFTPSGFSETLVKTGSTLDCDSYYCLAVQQNGKVKLMSTYQSNPSAYDPITYTHERAPLYDLENIKKLSVFGYFSLFHDTEGKLHCLPLKIESRRYNRCEPNAVKFCMRVSELPLVKEYKATKTHLFTLTEKGWKTAFYPRHAQPEPSWAFGQFIKGLPESPKRLTKEEVLNTITKELLSLSNQFDTLESTITINTEIIADLEQSFIDIEGRLIEVEANTIGYEERIRVLEAKIANKKPKK